MENQSKTQNKYQPVMEDIQMIQRQIVISSKLASQVLIKFNGDVYEALEYLFEQDDIQNMDLNLDLGNNNSTNITNEDEEIKIEENHINPLKRINQFRSILDEKDKLFTKVIDKKNELDDTMFHEFSYVLFNKDTKKFERQHKSMTCASFLEFITTPYINNELTELNETSFNSIKDKPFVKPSNEQENDEENEEINENIDLSKEIEELNKKEQLSEEEKNKQLILEKRKNLKKQLTEYLDNRVEVKFLDKKASQMVRAWQFNDACIMYKASDIKDKKKLSETELNLELNSMNNLSTKLLIHGGIIEKHQFHTGNAVIVNKWFHYIKNNS